MHRAHSGYLLVQDPLVQLRHMAIQQEHEQMADLSAALHSPHVEKYYDGTVGSFPALTSDSELEEANVNRLLMQLCKGAKEACEIVAQLVLALVQSTLHCSPWLRN